MSRSQLLVSILMVGAFAASCFSYAYADDLGVVQPPPTDDDSALSWWVWPIVLFVFTFLLGVLAVAAGVGGGVLFVPIVSSFFPFNLDFVRGAGLLVALTGALSAGSGLLKRGLADLRLSLPTALIASISAIVGAKVGLAVPASVVQVSLGLLILGIVAIMLMAKKSDYPEVKDPDTFSQMLGISGIYIEESLDKRIHWTVHRTPLGLLLFVFVGFIGGMFGLGGGWASVPVLNLVMGAPLKIAVATSVFTLALNSTTAAWIYLNQGAVIPLIAVPSVAGMMLGTRIGVKVLAKAKPTTIKWVVIVFMVLAGARSVQKGLGF